MLKSGRNLILITAAIVFIVTCCMNMAPQANASRPDALNGPGPVMITDENDQYYLGKSLMVVEDKKGILEITDINAELLQGEAIISTEKTLSYGFTDNVYWLIFELENNSSQNELYLEVAYPALNYLDLYYFQEEELVHHSTGNMLPFYERDVIDRNFIFTINPAHNETQKYYLRVETESSMVIPVILWKPAAQILKSKNEKLFYGINYGMIFAMFLYNLFLFISLRSKSYYYYIMFILSFLFFQLVWNGLAYEYLWPDNPDWNRQSISFFIVLSTTCLFLFTKYFLQTKETVPTYNKLMNWFLGFCFVFLPLTILLPYKNIREIANLTTLSSVLLLIITFICLKKGFRPARFYLAALSLFLLGVILTALMTSGILPDSMLRFHGIHFSFVVMILLFALALVDRINTLNMEKAQFQQKNMEMKVNLLNVQREMRENSEMVAETLRRSNERLKELDMMKNEFISSVTHELRTPMTSILGFSMLIEKKLAKAIYPELDKYDKKEKKALLQVKDSLRILTEETKRLMEMINDVLDISKMDAGELEWHYEPVSFSEVIEESLAVIKSGAEKKQLTYKLEIIDDLPIINGDKKRLIQVMENLLSNAVNFTKKGNIIISVGLENDCKALQVCVSDEGIGIAPEDIDVIFDRFKQAGHTLKDKPKGTGLGLSICREIVRHHGGKIWAESSLGVGTKIFFTLPV